MTKQVTLKKGYVDQEDNAHREVTLRCPKMLDDVEAEKLARKSGHGPDSSYFDVAFVLQCIVSFDGIPEPQMRHLLDLGRHDFISLRKAVAELEKAEMAAETEGNSSDDEGSSSSSTD